MHRIRLMIFIVLLFGLMVLPLQAQADDAEVMGDAQTYSGHYLLTAAEGEFRRADDGTFTLMVRNFEQPAPWVISQPSLLSGTSEALPLLYAWALADTPDAEQPRRASVTVADLDVQVRLSNPDFGEDGVEWTFDAEILGTYTVLEADLENALAGLKLDTPMLALSLDETFQQVIDAGFQVIQTTDGVRFFGPLGPDEGGWRPPGQLPKPPWPPF